MSKSTPAKTQHAAKVSVPVKASAPTIATPPPPPQSTPPAVSHFEAEHVLVRAVMSALVSAGTDVAKVEVVKAKVKDSIVFLQSIVGDIAMAGVDPAKQEALRASLIYSGDRARR